MFNQLQSQGAPVILPHWEWRTFAPAKESVPALDTLGTRLAPSDSHETSLICLSSSHDVSIREGRLSLKWRKQAGQDGLELWDVVLDTLFPCSRETIQRLFELWGIPSPKLERSHYPLETFLQEAVRSHPDLRLVEVDKHAESFTVEGACCEWTRLVANQVQFECLCIEHEDPGLTLQVVRRLGLQATPHASYSTGLKSALQLNTQH